jgi:hypothetical protein
MSKMSLTQTFFYTQINIESTSAVDLHRFDADPHPDSTFHFDGDPDPDPDLDRHKKDADSHADHIPSSTHVGKKDKIFTFIHSNASLQFFLFLISGKCDDF